MMLGLYRFITTIGAPLIHIYLGRRLKAGKEDPHRFNERLGQAALARPDGSLVWMHGASVGEALSLLALIERLRADRPGVNLLITTGTVTSARLLADRLPPGVVHQYVPVDRLAYVRRFLDHWQPDLALWAESEFWPNLIAEISDRRIPLVLVNGRISTRSLRSWSRAPGFIAHLLRSFDLCLGQTAGDAERLIQLGASQSRSVGNLKFAAAPLPADPAKLTWLRERTQGRPLWLAASTWPGEEEIAFQVHQALAARFPGLLTVIAPRHPARGGDILSTLTARGARVARRAAGDDLTADADIYLADTMGELGLFFSLADVVFMGKSLTAAGGQNLLEPARLDCAIIHGPKMDNFVELSRRMAEAEAARLVQNAEDLADAISGLLGDSDSATKMAARASGFALAEAGVIDRLMIELAPYLDRLNTRDRAS